MDQIAIKLPEELLKAIDQLVAEGRFPSRSAAVRAGLSLVAKQAREVAIDEQFRKGFEKFPDSPREVAEAHRLAIDAIEEEPWERWW